LGATHRTIYYGRFDTMDRGEERKAAEVVTAPPDRKRPITQESQDLAGRDGLCYIKREAECSAREA
jgi:hypothetical protein